MKHLFLMGVAAVSFTLPAHAEGQAPIPSPGEIAAAAPTADWIAIAPSDLLVMDLVLDAKGKPRRVVIQLMPAPFSQGWIGNIHTLAAARWWDGTSVNRVQDNYVAQWGDATEKKALPVGLVTMSDGEYIAKSIPHFQNISSINGRAYQANSGRKAPSPLPPTDKPEDLYAAAVGFAAGWPVAAGERFEYWPVHCYGAVGVGRNMSPDTGSGAELYAVIGHAPRHLDRNIAVVGRVISGIEHLSSLPRGTGALGFYEDEKEHVAIVSIRIATDLPVAEQPRFEYLSTESDSFALYADARQNRRDPFFIQPAGGADICNIPVPVRPRASK